MESFPELDQLNLDPAAKTQVASLIQSLFEQRQQDAEQLQAQEAALEAKDHEIQEKDFKIQALTHELAHIRRLRYGVKSESLGPLQRDLFEETLDTDRAAITTEIEQLADDQLRDTASKPERPRAGQAANHYRRIFPASNIVMNLRLVTVDSAARTW